MTADPKPRARVKDRDASKRKLLEDASCRFCSRRASDGHHIVLRSQGGDDVEDNILPLCHDCHMGYHAGAINGLRLTKAETLYVRLRLGERADDYMIRRRLLPARGSE